MPGIYPVVLKHKKNALNNCRQEEICRLQSGISFRCTDIFNAKIFITSSLMLLNQCLFLLPTSFVGT